MCCPGCWKVYIRDLLLLLQQHVCSFELHVRCDNEQTNDIHLALMNKSIRPTDVRE